MNLKELSALLGLSPTTVSRALNGYPEVGKATRDRVLTAATITRYSPSRNAQRLAAGRGNSVAVVWTSSRDLLQRQFATSFFRHLTEVSNQLDVHLVSVPSGHDDGLARIRSLFSAGAVNAALFINPLTLPSSLDLPFPSLVFRRRPILTTRVSWVDIDYRAMSRQAVDFLIQLGHRLVAVAGTNSRAIDDISQGAIAAADSSLGRTVTISRIEKPAERWDLLAGNGPTAILCSNLTCAEEIACHISADGRAVGNDISIIAFDDGSSSDFNAAHAVRFTTLRLDLQIAAKTVLQALRKSIDVRGRERRLPILLKADLVLGETTASANEFRIRECHPATPPPITHTEAANANTGPALFST
jgi:LacI family transcriptional regulator